MEAATSTKSQPLPVTDSPVAKESHRSGKGMTKRGVYAAISYMVCASRSLCILHSHSLFLVPFLVFFFLPEAFDSFLNFFCLVLFVENEKVKEKLKQNYLLLPIFIF